MSSSKFIIGMRDSFFNALYDIAKKDKNVIIIIDNSYIVKTKLGL